MKSLALVFVHALALLVPTWASAQNMVQNGSFEDTRQASGTWNVYSSVNGWSTLQGPGLEIRNNIAGAAYDGVNYVELDSHNATLTNSWIGQTVATTSGLDYILSFFYSPRIGVAAASNGLNVYWGNSLLNPTVITASGLGLSAHAWTQYSYTVRGSGSDLLSFRAMGTSDSYGGSLDAVSLVTAVPEPETYAMLLAGLMFISFVMRRRSV